MYKKMIKLGKPLGNENDFHTDEVYVFIFQDLRKVFLQVILLPFPLAGSIQVFLCLPEWFLLIFLSCVTQCGNGDRLKLLYVLKK